MNYIDEKFAQYSSGRFGVEKSWHITTKLPTESINNIVEPWRGANYSFQAGNAEQSGANIFYATLRSLNRKAIILTQYYNDKLVVSTELVNSLSTNTYIKAVVRLIEEEAVATKSTLNKLSNTVGASGNTSTTVGNKHNNFLQKN